MNITQWLKTKYPKLFAKFLRYAEADELYDITKQIHNQDYTMLVGIISGFAKMHGESLKGYDFESLKILFEIINTKNI